MTEKDDLVDVVDTLGLDAGELFLRWLCEIIQASEAAQRGGAAVAPDVIEAAEPDSTGPPKPWRRIEGEEVIRPWEVSQEKLDDGLLVLAAAGYAVAARTLVSAGADPDATDPYGRRLKDIVRDEETLNLIVEANPVYRGPEPR
jgi:hypothetical protein